jgi:hypothetical protein
MDTQQHIIEVIQETVYRRVANTVDEYVHKNDAVLQQNNIAGIEWHLDVTVLTKTPIPTPQTNRAAQTPRTLFQRFIDFLTHIWPKAENAQERADQKAQ